MTLFVLATICPAEDVPTVETRKLEYDCPPAPKLGVLEKKEDHHKSSQTHIQILPNMALYPSKGSLKDCYVHIPAFWSLLCYVVFATPRLEPVPPRAVPLVCCRLRGVMESFREEGPREYLRLATTPQHSPSYPTPLDSPPLRTARRRRRGHSFWAWLLGGEAIRFGLGAPGAGEAKGQPAIFQVTDIMACVPK